MKRLFLLLFLLCGFFATGQAQLNVRLVTDEAEAVLNVLSKRKANSPITDADWQRIFQSEGYVRLKHRETSMQRSFTEEDFKTFALSDQLVQRAAALENTLARWRRVDVTHAGKLALAYLPKDARINAKIYPVIKPRDNSFVFDIKNDPAIFLYLDPDVSPQKFENTLAHELHHIGFGTVCPTKRSTEATRDLPPSVLTATQWLGAFGEGFAMLAAAGGPDVHPHAVSKADERQRWDSDLANFNDDLKKLEGFFLDILKNKLTAEQIQQRGFSFFGTQGPWYTVGWKMAVMIEKTQGRAKLIEVFCDQRNLLPVYNEAAALHNRTSPNKLPLWSVALVGELM